MDLAERYNSYSNSQLLQIIDNAADYQPEAVETAKAIICGRQLTAEDMDAAKKELAAGKQAEIEKLRKQKEKEEKYKAAGRSVLENINPIKDTYSKADKVINVVTIVFGCFYLIWFVGQIRVITYLLTDIFFDLSVLAYFLQLIYMPITLVLFYRRKKSGWILFLLYLLVSSAAQLVALYRSIHWNPSGVPAMDGFFAMNHPVVYTLSFAFLAGTIWVICKKDVRSVFWKQAR